MIANLFVRGVASRHEFKATSRLLVLVVVNKQLTKCTSSIQSNSESSEALQLCPIIFLIMRSIRGQSSTCWSNISDFCHSAVDICASARAGVCRCKREWERTGMGACVKIDRRISKTILVCCCEKLRTSRGRRRVVGLSVWLAGLLETGWLALCLSAWLELPCWHCFRVLLLNYITFNLPTNSRLQLMVRYLCCSSVGLKTNREELLKPYKATSCSFK